MCIPQSDSRRPSPVTSHTWLSRVHDHLAAVARVVRVGFRSLHVLKVMAPLRVGCCVVNVWTGDATKGSRNGQRACSPQRDHAVQVFLSASALALAHLIRSCLICV